MRSKDPGKREEPTKSKAKQSRIRGVEYYCNKSISSRMPSALHQQITTSSLDTKGHPNYYALTPRRRFLIHCSMLASLATLVFLAVCYSHDSRQDYGQLRQKRQTSLAVQVPGHAQAATVLKTASSTKPNTTGPVSTGIPATATHNSTTPSIPTSLPFIQSSVTTNTCRFPLFYDPRASKIPFRTTNAPSTTTTSHPYYYAKSSLQNWRTQLKKHTGRSSNFEYVLSTARYAKTLHHRKSRVHHNNNTRHRNNNITFVHVGKAGGSSVGCALRGVRHYLKSHCDNNNNNTATTAAARTTTHHDSAISRHVNCYTHWDKNLQCFYLQGGGSDGTGQDPSTLMSKQGWNNPYHNPMEQPGAQQESNRHGGGERLRGNDYLINLRNPLDRIASWFVYEHSENHDSGT